MQKIHMQKRAAISLVLFGAFATCVLLHSFLSALLEIEDALFFLFASLLGLASLVSLIFTFKGG